MSAAISDVTKEKIKQYLIGTCNTIADAEDAFDLDYDSIVDALDGEVELCNTCDWWFEVYELSIDDNAHDHICDDCRGEAA